VTTDTAIARRVAELLAVAPPLVDEQRALAVRLLAMPTTSPRTAASSSRTPTSRAA
jgi:hypothetical protein